jgi:hypothetical protein
MNSKPTENSSNRCIDFDVIEWQENLFYGHLQGFVPSERPSEPDAPLRAAIRARRSSSPDHAEGWGVEKAKVLMWTPSTPRTLRQALPSPSTPVQARTNTGGLLTPQSLPLKRKT